MRLTALLVILVCACAVQSCGAARVRGGHRTRGWATVSTEHVLLRTDVDPDAAMETAWALEDFDRALAAVFLDCPRLATRARTEVVLLDDVRDYVDVAPPQSGGFFSFGRTGVGAIPPRVIIPASGDGRHVNVAQVFVHELTHRFVQSCLPDAPVWLNEGLATYFETLRVRDDVVLVGIAPFRFEAGGPRELVRADGAFVHQLDPALLMRASTLVGLAPEAFYARDQDRLVGYANYAGAWALVHLLLVGGDGDLRARFARFLQVLRTARVDARSAFAEAFQGRDLDAELAAYLGAQHLRRRVPYSPATFARPAFAVLAPADVDLLWAELFLPQPDHARRARAYLERARRTSSTRVHALLLLAGMETDGMQRRRLVEEASEASPGHREVLRARGWLEVERGMRDATSEALFAEISSLQDPSTIDRILRARLAAQGRDAVGAVEAGEAAVREDPTSWSARYALGLAYIAASRWDEARLELNAVLHTTMEHEPEVTREVRARLRGLARGPRAPAPVATVETPLPPEVPGTFSPQAVVRAINMRRSAIQACYEQALRSTPVLVGRLTVQLTIETSGETTTVHPVSETGGLDEVSACICRVIDQLSFDPAPVGASVTYTFPFVFEPQS